MASMQKRIEAHLSPEVNGKLRQNPFFSKLPVAKPRLYLGGHIAGFRDKDGPHKYYSDANARERNENAAIDLENHFTVFLPQRDNPFGILKYNSQGFEMAFVDALAIRKAKVFFAVGGFENDTSWECGFATDKRSFNVLFLPDGIDVQKHWKDWMLLLSFDCVIVPEGWSRDTHLPLHGAVPPDLKVVEFGYKQDVGNLVAGLFKEWKKEKFAQRVRDFIARFGGKKEGASDEIC